MRVARITETLNANDTYRIWPISDTHLGAADVDEELLREHVEMIRQDKNARVIFLGDELAKDLFGEHEPVGETVLVNQSPFVVIGVMVAQVIDVQFNWGVEQSTGGLGERAAHADFLAALPGENECEGHMVTGLPCFGRA